MVCCSTHPKVICLSMNHQPVSKTLSYIEDNEIHLHEYDRYVHNLITLGLKLDTRNVYPKDFETEQVKIAAAVSDKLNVNKKAAMSRIHDTLMADKRVRKYLRQNTQYMVFVPESPEELVQEGNRLHNCLASYVDQVSEGNTSIFFIREATNPEAPFYAMEVRNGNMIQLHGINNCRTVSDSPLDKFANGFARLLKRMAFDPKTVICAA